jgi:hypothetical protein
LATYKRLVLLRWETWIFFFSQKSAETTNDPGMLNECIVKLPIIAISFVFILHILRNH